MSTIAPGAGIGHSQAASRPKQPITPLHLEPLAWSRVMALEAEARRLRRETIVHGLRSLARLARGGGPGAAATQSAEVLIHIPAVEAAYSIRKPAVIGPVVKSAARKVGAFMERHWANVLAVLAVGMTWIVIGVYAH